MQSNIGLQASKSSAIEINKVLKNTYMLLSMTLAFSAVTAAISMSLNLPHGAALIMTLVAFGLISKKDFSFMGGFLMVGLIVVIVASIANIFFQIPALSLAVSAAIIMIMSGLILFDTSRIINGGETNYIRATISLYLNIYNIFVHLLHLLGVMGGDD